MEVRSVVEVYKKQKKTLEEVVSEHHEIFGILVYAINLILRGVHALYTHLGNLLSIGHQCISSRSA